MMAHLPSQIHDATLRLLLAPGIGPATLRKLRSQFGDDERVVAAQDRDLKQIGGIGTTTAQALCRAINDADIDDERALMEMHGVQIVLHGDADYPTLLAAIPDPPSGLWVKGELTMADRLAIDVDRLGVTGEVEHPDSPLGERHAHVEAAAPGVLEKAEHRRRLHHGDLIAVGKAALDRLVDVVAVILSGRVKR